MNVESVTKQLKNKYPQSNVVENKNLQGEITEILCEIEAANEHPEYSKAMAVLDSSVQHKHLKTTETYKVIKGELHLFVSGEEYLLQEGDFYVIEPGKPHFAKGDETWVEVTSNPGWTLEDHIIC